MEVEEFLGRLVSEGVVRQYGKRRERRFTAKAERLRVAELADTMRRAGARLPAITCVDLGDDFELVYHFDLGGSLIDVKVRVGKAVPKVASITSAYPVAEFYEREILEMFGVKFEGLPRPEKLYLPDDWPEWDKPMRKR